MILGVDTDVLVHWTFEDAPRHEACRNLLRRQVESDGFLGITPQTLFELVHVVTDSRRFEHPLTMREALQLARTLWNSRDVHRIEPGPQLLGRTLAFLESMQLGRKRILDTALAVTLEQAGVRRLATLNERDFRAFAFLEVVTP